ncbi:hypothetical protein Pmar_PMAR008570, partial [Perkinsus marinus ATCC 50983]
MPVTESDIARLQQQIAELSAVVSMKQDMAVTNDQSGNPVGVKDCLLLLENKMKGMEDRVKISVADLHTLISNNEERLDTITDKLNDCVTNLDRKIDAQSNMMQSMYKLLDNMANQSNKQQAPNQEARPTTKNPRSPPRIMTTNSHARIERSEPSFDYKSNSRVVVFGVAEPDDSSNILNGADTGSRPTVRTQVEDALKAAG